LSVLINSSEWAVIISALSFGLLSSLHCISMCGPLICQTSNNNIKNMVLYQIGRLLSYLTLGFSLYSLSSTVLKNLSSSLQNYSLLILILIYFYVGVTILIKKKKPSFTNKYLSKMYKYLFAKISTKKSSGGVPFFMGLISALLPCGLLHAFLLGVVPMQKPLVVFLYISSFWISTSPALMGVGFSLNKLKSFFKVKSPHALGIFYVFMGFYLVYIRFYAFQNQVSCH
jgi:uncharacterized protein